MKTKNEIIKKIKKDAVWYVNSQREGIILDGNFRSFENLSLEELKEIIADTSIISYAYTDQYGICSGSEIIESDLINFENNQKLIYDFCLTEEKESVEFEKDYCIITSRLHGWTSRAKIFCDRVRGIEFDEDLTDAEKSRELSKLETEWQYEVNKNIPKIKVWDLEPLSFGELKEAMNF
jgi:hypothetical protein